MLLKCYLKANFTKNNLACAKIDGKWGIIDRTGNWVLKPQILSLPTIVGNYIIVEDSMFYYGIMDLTGKYVLEPTNKYKIYPPLREYFETDIDY